MIRINKNFHMLLQSLCLCHWILLIHPLPMMHEMSTRVPLQLLVSVIVTTVPMMITSVAVLILILARPIVPTWLVIPRVHNRWLLWLLHLDLHEILIVFCVSVLKFLLTFFYKLRLLACQSVVCHS